MMDELIRRVADKTGLSLEQSKSVVELVCRFLKEKLPEPVAAHLEGILAGGTGGDGSNNGLLGGAVSSLGSLFGDGK